MYLRNDISWLYHYIFAAKIAHDGVDQQEDEVVTLGEKERAREVAHLLLQYRALLRQLQGVDVRELHLQEERKLSRIPSI